MPKRNKDGNEEAKRSGETTGALMAAHEAAHSFVVIKNKDIGEKFKKASIIGRNGLDGYTDSLRKPPNECTPEELKAALMATMARKAVEELLVGISTGHAGDMRDARITAKEVPFLLLNELIGRFLSRNCL
ncbi:hypothetical protein niasHT_039998 [Heterodera trifolii]|uniref:Uncharacterized protein n=1 Tax=Heterodera trifolii TaxID=157864 RepID=A0ABD2J3J5_9BILA